MTRKPCECQPRAQCIASILSVDRYCKIAEHDALKAKIATLEIALASAWPDPDVDDPEWTPEQRTEMQAEFDEFKAEREFKQAKAEAFDWLDDHKPLQISRVRDSECRGDVSEIIFGHTGRTVSAKTLLKAVRQAMASEKSASD